MSAPEAETGTAEPTTPEDVPDEQVKLGRVLMREVLENAMGPMRTRDLILAFRDLMAEKSPALPTTSVLIRAVMNRMLFNWEVLHKGGAWVLFEQAKAMQAEAKPRRKGSFRLYEGRAWPPLGEPWNQPLDVSEHQARIWKRCAGPGCQRRCEVIVHLGGMSETERGAALQAETTGRTFCWKCQAKEEQAAAARARLATLQAEGPPVVVPPAIARLLLDCTDASDAKARADLHMLFKAHGAAFFRRLMMAVSRCVAGLAPPAAAGFRAAATHRSRLGAFEVFAALRLAPPSGALRSGGSS